MPNSPSWNGRWSGEENLYAKVVSFKTKAQKEYAAKIIGSFYYRWNDGWGACITVSKVDSTEARRIRKKSQGFCGYDWMIDNIISHGSPYSKEELVDA
jgi:hypothetical protein